MKIIPSHELSRLSTEEFRLADKQAVILAADSIRSGHNIGSLFRLADSFRLEGIILGPQCALPGHPEVQKTALSSDQHLDWEQTDHLAELLIGYKNKSYIIVGIEHTDQSIPLNQFSVSDSGKYILVFGHEIHGISEPVLSVLDVCLEIPQLGVKHSLNVSVAAGIATWHFIKKRI